MLFRRIKKSITVCLTCVFVISLVGCGSQQAGTQENKNMIIVSRPTDSDNLDPVIQHGNTNIWMFNIVMDSLVMSDAQGKNVVPCLAEKWDVSADGLTYTFHLKNGVKFSDGTPVKGEDWVFSLLRARDTKESPWKSSLEDIKDIKAPNDNTVVITLKRPYAPLLASLAMFNASVTSKAYFEKIGPQGYSQKPVGTGPFYIAEWKKGEYILFKKNPHYRTAGAPKVDEIKVVVVPDDNTRIMQLQAGTVDVATFVPFNRMTELKNDPNLTVLSLPSTETSYAILNNEAKPFDNVKVRKALRYATDQQALNKTVLYGFGEPALSFMPKSGKFWNGNLKSYAYDVEKAKALLAESGYAQGLNVELLIRSGNSVQQQVATVLKEQWSKVGINTTITQLEAATTTAKYRKGDFQVTLRGWTDDMVDPSQLVDYFCGYKNTKNFATGWRNNQVEEWVDQAKAELDTNKREQFYFKIQEVHNDEAPLMPLFHIPYTVAMRKNISGFVQTSLGNYMFEELVKK